ncbi:hypothetical protein [Actinoplanes sp. URMC 104]|uniref:hypothetical protein n=1 Tax=Actinoplanes sp. URMC 104 TaxID=3423409 RepID=UPI003F1A250D
MTPAAEHERYQSQGQGLAGFPRDVLVNVLANLIAAAIIYLLGVLFDLLPRSSAAIILSILFSLYALTMALMTVGGILRKRSSGKRLFGLGTLLLGVMMLAGSIYGMVEHEGAAWVGLLLGLWVLLTGIAYTFWPGSVEASQK